MLKQSGGFSLIETILVGCVAIVILIIGLFLYDHDHSPQAIILNKQKAIDGYVKKLSPSNYSSFGTSLYSKGLITTSLYNATQSLITGYSSGSYLNNLFFNQYICVEDIPNSFSYGPVTLNSSGNTATLPVNVFVPGSLSSIPYSANWVETSSGWQLTSVNCH